MSTQKKLMTNWRWWLCSLLFVATTVNYLDRQVLSLTYEEFIKPEFHWTDAHYGTITSFFSIFYAIACLFAGKFVDWMGTKKGYLIAIGVWSGGACLHAACGWVSAYLIDGIDSVGALRAVEKGSELALAISTTSVYLFLLCRGILALGEAGNFPAAIKVTAEYFPKKDRAFATSIFNAGASVGALAAPLTIPPLAQAFGWEWAFIIIGGLGFLWMFFWQFMYDKPEESKHVNEAELEYVHQDDAAEAAEKAAIAAQKSIPMLQCFRYRQTWSFVVGKFFTIGGYLPKIFVDKKGMNPYAGRMLAMLIFAFFPIAALFAQPLGVHFNSPWWPAILIGLAAAGHQAWSANLFSTVGDMFPKSTIATITGIVAGNLFTYAEHAGSAFHFMGFEGKPAGYFIVFCCCGVAYLLAWTLMKTLVPKYKAVEI